MGSWVEIPDLINVSENEDDTKLTYWEVYVFNIMGAKFPVTPGLFIFPSSFMTFYNALVL